MNYLLNKHINCKVKVYMANGNARYGVLSYEDGDFYKITNEYELHQYGDKHMRKNYFYFDYTKMEFFEVSDEDLNNFNNEV